MRFRSRAFLLCFVPFALLLSASFWMIQRLVQNTVRDGLRSSLRENQMAIARIRSKSDLQNSRFLNVVGENPSLKAGMQLLLYDSGADARRTVEDQLRELCERMGFDFLLVSAPDGRPLAGVLRRNGQAVPLDLARLHAGQTGLLMIDDRAYQTASVPIDEADENIGSLSVGEFFDFSEFTTPAVLIRDGEVLKSSIQGISVAEIERGLAGCAPAAECNVRLRGVNYVSTPMQTVSFGSGYVLRSLQNLDSAVGPVRAVLRNLFLTAAFGAVMVAFIVSVVSAGSIGRPIGAVIAHLRRAENTGVLPEFRVELSPIREIRDLTDSFNRAAAAIREARDSLQHAYLEFIGSLASALDARDPYTAGHSRRVSDLSCAVAATMGLPAGDIERIRVGALLHDIGKIGVSDALLQKPGRLTEEEFAMIRKHPEIGKRILEGVHGFTAYLPAVELHHENWDGSGYPWGQTGEETHIDARIIHVVDAWDAMTTNRPYRNAMSGEQAIRTLKLNTGTQFDPSAVKAFVSVQEKTRVPAAESALIA